MMSIFCVLGKIEFDVLEVAALTFRYGVTYAQHDRVMNKPRIEAMGDKLIEGSLEVQWHKMFAAPVARLQVLMAAFQKKQPLPLVYGNGEFVGLFVISELEPKPVAQFSDGTWFAGGAHLNLLEYVGPLPDENEGPPSALAIAQRGMPIAAMAASAGQIMGGAAPSVATLGQLASQANSFAAQLRTGLGAAASGLDLLKRMQSNPLAALGQLPSSVAQLGQLLPGSSGLVRTLGAIAPKVGNDSGAQWLNLGLQVATQSRTAVTALRQLDGRNLPGQIAVASAAIGQASSAMTALATPLAKFAVNQALRIGGI